MLFLTVVGKWKKANKIARKIVQEIYLTKKTVPPIDAGGIAGGEKYSFSGIFFKLVRENSIYENYDQASRAALHELKVNINKMKL